MNYLSENLSTKVIFSQKIPPTQALNLRNEISVKYYEFVYISNENDIQYLNEQIKIMQKGDIVIRKPGDLVRSYTLGNNYRVGFTTDEKYIAHLVETLPNFSSPSDPKKTKDFFIKITNNEKNKNLNILNQRISILNILYSLHKDFHRLNINSYLDKCIDYMNNNYHKKISVQNIADHLHISKSYLHKIFKERYSQTPIEYLTHLRLEHAIRLMSKNSLSITKIAKNCGIDSYSYFYKLFTDIYHIPPAKFAKEVFY